MIEGGGARSVLGEAWDINESNIMLLEWLVCMYVQAGLGMECLVGGYRCLFLISSNK